MAQISLVGIDLAKHVFQLHAADSNGVALIRRQLRRNQLIPFLAQLPPCQVAMEACCGAHQWARRIEELGHRVRLLPPQYVKAFVQGQKNDRNDAQAICEAASRPNMPSVAVKSVDQQQIMALHRVRDQLVKQRTAVVNQLRGLLAEFGIVVAQGRRALMAALPGLLEDAENGIPPLMRIATDEQRQWLADLDERIQLSTKRLELLAKQSVPCRALTELRGIGPLVATAFVAEVGDPRAFRNGRQVAAWLGLVPRQHSSGGKTRLSGISKGGDPYLRSLVIHGARAFVRTAARHDDAASQWAVAVESRRGRKKAIVAVANKLTRRLWATWRYAAAA